MIIDCITSAFRVFRLDASGWIGFSITRVVKTWVEDLESDQCIDVWIERVRSGTKARRAAQKTHFARPTHPEEELKPTLMVHYKDRGKHRLLEGGN